ncbi:MAG: hypothetical protein ACR2OC_04495 [Solirubrobacterales bacterium]
MADSRQLPEATELVYLPEPSWRPLFVAAGLAVLLAGLFAGLFWSILGAIVLLIATVGWYRSINREVDRLPRSQRVSSAVLPAIPPRSRG